jgi:dipeptidyl aminopeptidase/acylaminoacyl peptidase
VVEQESTLSRHTIYRPSTLPSEKLPIVSWGNGGCGANGLSAAEFLAEIASHGYLVIANGAPNGGGSDPDNGSTHIAAIDWATDEGTDPCSKYYNHVATDKVAVMGYSCGGLMSLNAAGDARLSTVVAMNSGLINPNQNVYSSMHTPVAYFNGGSGDIAYANGQRDYQNITRVPVYHANLPVGHGGTYNQDNGGEFARVGVAWLNWHLKNNQTASGRGMFLGNSCGICGTNWVIEHKNFQ